MVAVTNSTASVPPQVEILGVPLTLYDLPEMLAFIAAAQQGERRLVLSGNVHSFNLAYENPWLRDFFRSADAVRLDGAGVRLAAKLLGYDAPPRMTWADFAWPLAETAAERGLTLFLLGSRPGVAEKAAARLQAHAPTLQIAGTHHGYFNKTPGAFENEGVLQIIREAAPDILIVGFGMPLQEHWLSQNIRSVRASAILTGGAVFDYISGDLQRAPQWMTNSGLEWLGRLLIEPRRLWKRYVLGNPRFFWRVLRGRLGL